MDFITERQALCFGNILDISGEKCTIHSIRGEGTSSIVYEADLNGRRIILKELYPIGLEIKRNDDFSLTIWEQYQDSFEVYKQKLKKAFKLQLDFFNEFPNHIVEPQKLYEYNNTLYIIMHLSGGNSYDKVKPTDILSILEVGKSLSSTIKFYHQKKYLNLDIKPENIFVFPETNQLIQLFDFDTVSTKEDILKNRFSYSNGYEAPEVRGSQNGNFQLSDIGCSRCEASR